MNGCCLPGTVLSALLLSPCAENLGSIGTVMTLVSQKMKGRLRGHLPYLINNRWSWKSMAPESRALMGSQCVNSTWKGSYSLGIHCWNNELASVDINYFQWNIKYL